MDSFLHPEQLELANDTVCGIRHMFHTPAQFQKDTLPETNIAPKNDGFQ